MFTSIDSKSIYVSTMAEYGTYQPLTIYDFAYSGLDKNEKTFV